MKGQFMLISSIIAGIIIISASSSISRVQSTSLDRDKISNTAEIVKEEADEVFQSQNDLSSEEVKNLKQMVSGIGEYRTDVEYWDKPSPTTDCFNVTLRSPEQRAFLRCIN